MLPCVNLETDKPRYDALIIVGPKPSSIGSDPFDMLLVKMSKVI